ncbi:hypothetical protein EBI_25746 [Enterocytozoon bieneusi H348]|nr:hypothetical protein EBI_25746 [Enterocytozoon bieneusi H348]|eukprot:XP_002650033.1 hypothetical protein EBI_25746 [Enterocytozoon bieneusi H348]
MENLLSNDAKENLISSFASLFATWGIIFIICSFIPIILFIIIIYVIIKIINKMCKKEEKI